MPWEQVLAILAINRLVDPGSEWRVHREWFLQTALDELLGVDFAAAAKDRLYRCLDRLVEHKDALYRHLVEQWRTLFDAKFDVLLYDLTSTYFEGLVRADPQGQARLQPGRPAGLPAGGDRAGGHAGRAAAGLRGDAGQHLGQDHAEGVPGQIESLYGKADRIWVMDRGIPTEEVLEQMRAEGVHYLVGTPKSRLSKMEQALLDRPWSQVHEAIAGEAARAGRRSVRAGPQRGSAAEGAGDPPAKAQAAGARPERPRSVARSAGTCCCRRSGPCEAEAGQVKRFVKIQSAQGRRAGDAGDVPLLVRLRPAGGASRQREGAYLLRGLPAGRRSRKTA